VKGCGIGYRKTIKRSRYNGGDIEQNKNNNRYVKNRGTCNSFCVNEQPGILAVILSSIFHGTDCCNFLWYKELQQLWQKPDSSRFQGREKSKKFTLKMLQAKQEPVIFLCKR
jgi:hypothetical protein